MKSRETKQKDLNALTESLQNSKSAMVVGFNKLSVNKDIEFRNSVRAAGAKYQVVKNTLARIAVKGTDFEQVTESLKGVTAIAWTDNDPVVLSKAISKFVTDNADVYTFKSGVVEGRLVGFSEVKSIASLPSKEELISKLLFVLNAQAQRIVTVINAVPRNLAIVIKQIGDKAPSGAAPEAEAEEAAPTPAAEAAPVAEASASEAQEEATSQEVAASTQAPAADEAPATENQEQAADQAVPAAGENTTEADAASDAGATQADKAE